MRISASFHHSSRRDNPSSDTARVTIKKISLNPTSRKSSHALAGGTGRAVNGQRTSGQMAQVFGTYRVNNRGPMTASGLYQVIARRGRQCGVAVFPHRFRHHFSHAWLDRGGAEGDLMELNGWTSPQMLRRYGASARSARARRSYDRIMNDAP
jgi:integrase